MWGRVLGVLALLAVGGLLFVQESQSPSLYSAIFYAFVIIMLSFVVLTVFTSRFKSRHGIHRHG
jgi:hypothetical protein